jgi:hypothetical protein
MKGISHKESLQIAIDIDDTISCWVLYRHQERTHLREKGSSEGYLCSVLGWDDVKVGVSQNVPGQDVQSHHRWIDGSIILFDVMYVLMYFTKAKQYISTYSIKDYKKQ